MVSAFIQQVDKVRGADRGGKHTGRHFNGRKKRAADDVGNQHEQSSDQRGNRQGVFPGSSPHNAKTAMMINIKMAAVFNTANMFSVFSKLLRPVKMTINPRERIDRRFR